MNVTPMIIIKNNLLIANMDMLLSYTDIHTDTSDNIVYHITFNSKH